MSVEDAIYDILKSAAGVAVLVGGPSAPRIYPVAVPPGKSGALVVYQQISSQDEESCDGPSDPRTDRVQISCWSARGVSGSPDQVRALAEAVRSAMVSATGSHGSVTVVYCRIIDEGDLYDRGDDENLARYGKRQDWEMAYS
jgi:hypothetical protein